MPRGCYVRKKKIFSLNDLPIDDYLTFQRFGYHATNVSPGGMQKVVCRCFRCGTVFDRIRRRVTIVTVCAKCAHRKDKGPVLFSHKEGYEKFTVTCVGCGRQYKLRRRSFEGTRMCPSCRRKSEVIPNEYILNEETLKRFGYNGATVTSKSHQRVVVRCATCGDIFERIRRNVKERPLCVKCARAKIDNEKLQAKCRQTRLSRYGKEGWVVSNDAYGVAEKEFKIFIEKIIKRPLRTQIHLLSRKILDLYDATTQIGIEYNGLNWHHEWSSTKRPYDYHRIKHKDCENEGISLITIFEDEWEAQPLAVENIFRIRFNTYLNKTGVVYKQLGFMLDTELEPDYTYVYTKKPRIRLSKQIPGNNGENHKDDKTIDEWAHVCGLARIWDCGKKRWILKL